MDQETLKRLAEAQAALNVSADEIRGHLAVIERWLQDLKLGIEVCVDLGAGSNEYLRFGKTNLDVARLYYEPVQWHAGTGDPMDSVPLLSAPRAVRIRACQGPLRTLIVAMLREAEKLVEMSELALINARELAAALSGKGAI